MRAFALGLIVGAGVCYAVIRITAPPPVRTAEPVAAQPSPPAAAETNIAPSCPEVASVAAAPPPPAQSDIPTRTTEPSVAPAPRKRITIDDFSEDEANKLCSALATRQMQRERDRKNAEAKDVGWAYQMEQLIAQYVEPRLSMDARTRIEVDCRTTFCEMKVTGAGDESRERAGKVGQQIATQPWSDIVNIGQSVTAEGERWQLTQEWFRPRTDAERRRWGRPVENVPN